MSQHSAEFLRGRMETIGEIFDAWQCMDSRPFREYIHRMADEAMDIAMNDAGAEASEAAPDAAAVIAQCREALEIARQQFGSHAGEGQNEELCEQALAAIAAYEEGR